MAKEKKTLFTLKIEPSLLNEWKAKANAASVSVAELIRRSVAGQKIECRPAVRHRPPPKVDPDFIFQVAAIGNNLNQIARRVNSGESFDVLVELASIEKQLSELVELAKAGKCTSSS